MHKKFLTLAVVAGFLIAAVPALAQDTGSYTTSTPTVTTPTTPATSTPTTPATTDTNEVDPVKAAGTAGTGASGSSAGELAETGGGNTWLLLAIGGALALGSAMLLARERLPRRNQ